MVEFGAEGEDARGHDDAEDLEEERLVGEVVGEFDGE